ncbi:MAG: hypothetical protein H6704_03260 [Myxococcales bacterium]|nr:hypothetical protein [Myxococcales bacterium]
MRRTVVLPVLLFVLGGSAAGAAPGLVVAPVVTERIDGQPAAGARGEPKLTKALRGLGLTVRPPAAMPGLADALAKGELAGRYPAVDWVLRVEIDASKLAEGVLETGFVRYDGYARAEVLTADTGELLGEVEARGQGMDLSPRTAALMAGEKAAAALAEKLTAAIPTLQATTRVRLTVTGVPVADEATQLAERLRSVPGVQKANLGVLKAGGEARLDLELEAGTAAELATRLDAAAGLGLRVDGFTSRAINAHYAPERRVRVELVVGPFENATGNPAEGWLRAAVPRVLATELSNHAALTVRAAPSAGAPRTAAEAPAWLKGGPEDVKGALLYVTGRVRYDGPKAALLVQVFRADDGRLLTSTEHSGPMVGFRGVVAAAAHDVTRPLLAAVLADDGMRAVAAAQRAPADAVAALNAEAGKRRLQAVHIEPGDGADVQGRVVVRGGADAPVRVRIASPDHLEQPVVLDVPAEDGEASLPFLAKLVNRAPVMPLEVEAAWRDGSAWHREVLRVTVMARTP